MEYYIVFFLNVNFLFLRRQRKFTFGKSERNFPKELLDKVIITFTSLF